MKIIKSISIFLLIGLALVCNTAFAKIELSVDRNDIRVNETFQLTIHVEDPKTLSAQQTLDFLPKEFHILASEHFQKSTVIDRQFANRMGWTITLLSNEAGTFSIPKFTIGNEQSEAITIRVLPALTNLEEINPNSKVKLTARISDETVYVQQQIIFSVRIYSSVASRRHNMSPLHVENAIVKKLGDSAEFQMLNKGISYNVKEEKYVIFPQKSGELTIPPINFRTNIVDTEASFGSLSRYRPIELKSKPFTVEVKPKPDTAELPWIPAKKLELSTKWQDGDKEFEVGKAATLDFYIKGVALLPEQLPTVEFPEVEGLKIYRDKPVIQNHINSNGVNSYHLEKLAVIPNAAGEAIIPAIKIPYWDTTKDEQAYAELAAIKVNIAESSEAVMLPAVSQPNSDTPPSPSDSSVAKTNYLWPIVSLGFALLWLITLGAYIVKRPVRIKVNKSEANNKKSQSSAQKIDLKKAASASDPIKLAKAIIQWVNQRSPVKVTNLNQLIDLCSDKEIIVELQQLQAALYSNKSGDATWNGQSIYQRLKATDFSQSDNDKTDQLPPLYPN